MGASTERLGLVIETSRTGTAVKDTTAEITQLGTAARVQTTSVVSAGKAVIDMEHNKLSAAQRAQSAQRQAAQERAAQLAAERAGIAESLELLRLRARTVDVTKAEEVAAIRESILLERQHLDSVKATEREYLQLQGILQGVETRAARTNRVFGQVPGERLRTGANALSSIALNAQSATLSGQSAVVAFGSLAQTLTLVGTAGRFAAMASGIGAAVVVATSLWAIWDRVDEKVTLTRDRMQEINRMSLSEIRGEIRRVSGEMDTAAEAGGSWLDVLQALSAGGAMGGAMGGMVLGRMVASRRFAAEGRADLEALTDRERTLAKAATERARALREQAIELRFQVASEERILQLRAQGASEAVIEGEQLAEQSQSRRRALEQLFTIRDEEGRVVALTAEQVRMKAELTGHLERIHVMLLQNAAAEAAVRQAQLGVQAGGNLREQFDAQMRLIEAQRIAEGAGVEATERAEIRKRQLRRETFMASISFDKQLVDALRASGDRTLKSVANVAESIRRIKIGALAAEAAVESAREFALVPAALARGAFGSAALHAASGVQLAAAAALGFRESFGGGGAGSGGAGGGGVSSTPTFEPTARARDGGMVINLIGRDLFGRETITRVAFELEKGEILNRPIPIAIGVMAPGNVA